jgi:hypothetical protein
MPAWKGGPENDPRRKAYKNTRGAAILAARERRKGLGVKPGTRRVKKK